MHALVATHHPINDSLQQVRDSSQRRETSSPSFIHITITDKMARPGSGNIPGSACIPLLILLLLLLLLLHPSEAQPSPGYYPSKMFRSMAFYEGYSTLWGPQHQTLSQDQKSLTLWMDRSSGMSVLSVHLKLLGETVSWLVNTFRLLGWTDRSIRCW